MTDVVLLKKAIKESGLKTKAILKATGIKSYATLRSRIKNKTCFSAKEISALEAILNLTKDQRDQIFFANDAE